MIDLLVGLCDIYSYDEVVACLKDKDPIASSKCRVWRSKFRGADVAIKQLPITDMEAIHNEIQLHRCEIPPTKFLSLSPKNTNFTPILNPPKYSQLYSYIS